MEMGRVRYNKAIVVLVLLVVVFLIIYILRQSGDSDNVGKTIKISQLLSASIYLAEDSGRRIVQIRHDPDIAARVKQKNLGQREYVTLGDHTSHDIITNGLSTVWPSLYYRSEEKNVKRTNEPTRHPPLYNKEVDAFMKQDEAVNMDDVGVWIDPLDATQEYTEGGNNPKLLEYVTVMICIVVKGQPIASVIHQPFAKGILVLIFLSISLSLLYVQSLADTVCNRMTYLLDFLFIVKEKQGITYWSWVNHGVSSSVFEGADVSTTSNIRIISSRSHPGNVREVANKVFKGQTVQHTIAAGAGYKSLQVAQRKADLYFHTTTIKKWDTCAGNALLSALGGEMTTRKGKSIDYSIQSEVLINDGLIATLSKDKHKEYLKKLSKM